MSHPYMNVYFCDIYYSPPTHVVSGRMARVDALYIELDGPGLSWSQPTADRRGRAAGWRAVGGSG